MAKQPMLGYRVIDGKMITYHVRKNRSGASTMYLTRRADKEEGMWFGTSSDKIFFTQKEAKADAVKNAERSVKSMEKWFKECKATLKQIRAIKVKD